MKISLVLLFLLFVFPNPSYSKIFELGMCYYLDQNDSKSLKSKWNINDYNILGKTYYKFVDPYWSKYGEKWIVVEDEYPIYDMENYNDVIKNGFTPINLFDKHVVSINFNNQIITRITEISLERIKITEKEIDIFRKIKKKYPNKWSAENEKSFLDLIKWSKKYRYIEEYKIENYAGGLISGRSLDNLNYVDGWAIQIDLDNQIYKMGQFDKLNNTVGNPIAACTDNHKNISVQKNKKPKSNSALKELLKKIY